MERALTDNPENRSSNARELAAMWRRIGSQHLSASQGCACGFGGLMIQAADFEIDIVEFVLGDARKSGLSGVEAYVNAVARRGEDRYSLPALLSDIEKSGDKAPAKADELDFILARLRTTLNSIETAHNSSRFVCD
jgi:hypothetical protein